MSEINSVSVVLLAGGTGARMNNPLPKQYLQLREKPIARYSFDLFLNLPEVLEIVVVCDLTYRDYFEHPAKTPAVHFALPGARRQDSLWNGLQNLSSQTQLVCVHDAARPLADVPLVRRVLAAAHSHGAATAGMPVKFTVKEIRGDSFVKQTPERQHIWEIQTPQAIRPDLLKKGFALAQERQLTVTDDVSLVELFGHPVKVVEGSHSNLKITTREDLLLAQRLLDA